MINHFTNWHDIIYPLTTDRQRYIKQQITAMTSFVRPFGFHDANGHMHYYNVDNRQHSVFTTIERSKRT